MIAFSTYLNSRISSFCTSVQNINPKDGAVFKISRILQALLPREIFCLISWGSIKIQSIILPRKWSYWSKINDRLYIGAIPQIKQVDAIHKLGVDCIVSVAKKYELKPNWFIAPATENDWKSKNIKYFRIPSPDLEPIPLSKIKIAVTHLLECFNKNETVYVHCIGGRGRSWTIVACFLICLNYTRDEAINHIKTCRPQVVPSRAQIKTVKAWEAQWAQGISR